MSLRTSLNHVALNYLTEWFIIIITSKPLEDNAYLVIVAGSARFRRDCNFHLVLAV